MLIQRKYPLNRGQVLSLNFIYSCQTVADNGALKSWILLYSRKKTEEQHYSELSITLVHLNTHKKNLS